MTLNRERDMKKTDQGIDWSTVVSRALLFSLLWWALTDGTAGSWWIGAPAVAGAVIISVTLVPPLGLVWREAMGFVPFFLWHSLKGGVDVARRSFDPRMPITPELIEYPLRLPPGLPSVILVNTVSLLPGTLSAELGGQVLRVHVLDSLGDFLAELEALEQRVGCMFRSASDDFPRR
jgi:multicomponent Na+:H+ antiporter subunit E